MTSDWQAVEGTLSVYTWFRVQGLRKHINTKQQQQHRKSTADEAVLRRFQAQLAQLAASLRLPQLHPAVPSSPPMLRGVAGNPPFNHPPGTTRRPPPRPTDAPCYTHQPAHTLAPPPPTTHLAQLAASLRVPQSRSAVAADRQHSAPSVRPAAVADESAVGLHINAVQQVILSHVPYQQLPVLASNLRVCTPSGYATVNQVQRPMSLVRRSLQAAGEQCMCSRQGGSKGLKRRCLKAPANACCKPRPSGV